MTAAQRIKPREHCIYGIDKIAAKNLQCHPDGRDVLKNKVLSLITFGLEVSAIGGDTG